MTSTIFWNVAPCGLVEVHQRFRREYCLQLQGQRVSQARNHEETAWCLVLSGFLLVNFYWTTWSYIPEDDTVHRLKGFEKSMLRRIFGTKGEEVTGCWI
jgi:hypothetical protein